MLSVEPWLVEHFCSLLLGEMLFGFSALSRAVVGGTHPGQSASAASASVSVLSVEPWLVEPVRKFTPQYPLKVSVLSVEPWLVEPFISALVSALVAVSVLSVEPWLVEPETFTP